jgi:hypothetical protein
MRNFSLVFTLAVSALLASASPTNAQEVVFNNTTNDLNQNLDADGNQIGDEIILEGTARQLYEFSFEYWGTTTLTGGETFNENVEARVRFYLNDGPAAPEVPGSAMPNTVFFESALFSLDPTPRSTVIFTNFQLGAVVPLTDDLPDTFTWSIEFSGLGEGEAAGVTLYSPPTVGNSFTDYWVNDGTSWSLQTNSVPVDFAARFIAVPEPSTFLLFGFGLVGLFAIVRRRA